MTEDDWAALDELVLPTPLGDKTIDVTGHPLYDPEAGSRG